MGMAEGGPQSTGGLPLPCTPIKQALQLTTHPPTTLVWTLMQCPSLALTVCLPRFSAGMQGTDLSHFLLLQLLRGLPGALLCSTPELGP